MKDIFKTDRLINKNAVLLSYIGSKSAPRVKVDTIFS